MIASQTSNNRNIPFIGKRNIWLEYLVAKMRWINAMAMEMVGIKGHLAWKEDMLKFKSNEVLENQTSGKNEKNREKEKAAKTRVSNSCPSLVTPSGRFEMQCSGNFPRWRYQGLSPADSQRYKKVSTAQKLLPDWRRGWRGPAHTTSNFAPNEYRGVVNSSGLAVYKGSTQEIKVQRKVKLKVNWGCEQ